MQAKKRLQMLERKTTVIFDVETQSKISDMPGENREHQIMKLEVSCLSYIVLDSDKLLVPSDAVKAVEDAEVKTLWRDVWSFGKGPFEELFDAFDEAELIVSFNGAQFDHLVLFKYCNKRQSTNHMCKIHDVFSRVRDSVGVWLSLDKLLKANNLSTKTSNGLEAIRMWQQGRRDELKQYCEQDVRQLARLVVLLNLALPNSTALLPNHVFGIASALASVRASNAMKSV